MKKFLLIWAGELLSNIGSGMTAFAISMYVYTMTGSVTLVSLTTLLAFLPTVLLGPVSGVLADRYDRRVLMIIGDLCSGLGLVYILLQIQNGNQSILPILVGITWNAVFVALIEPAYKATITDILTEDEYARASGMVQMAGNARYLISPALAGIILGFADIRLILLLDIGTFFLTVSMVAIIRKTIQKPIPRKQESFRKQLQEGFSIIGSNKGVRSLLTVMAFVCFFMGFIQTLTGPMVLAVSNAKTVGILESVCTVGMLVGSLWIGMIGIRRGYAKILCVAGIVCGVAMALSGVSTNLLFTGGSIFLFFMALPFMNTCADVLIRVSIPNRLQGRVWGIISLLTQSGTILAYALCGVLSDYIFEPLLTDDGVLADSVGRIIGTGAGRGIGLLLILSGIGMVVTAYIIGNNKSLKAIQVKGENLACAESF